MHQGQQYEVMELDLGRHKAFVKRVKVPYYTASRDHSDVDVLKKLEESDAFIVPGEESEGCIAAVGRVSGDSASGDGTSGGDASGGGADGSVGACLDAGTDIGAARLVGTGTVVVKKHVWGWRKVHLSTGKILGMGEFSLPPLEFTTQGGAQSCYDSPTYIHQLTHSLTHPLTHSLTHSLLPRTPPPPPPRPVGRCAAISTAAA
jgi:ATP-dependent helicase YprA (DUF1998 family)